MRPAQSAISTWRRRLTSAATGRTSASAKSTSATRRAVASIMLVAAVLLAADTVAWTAIGIIAAVSVAQLCQVTRGLVSGARQFAPLSTHSRVTRSAWALALLASAATPQTSTDRE